MNNLIFRSCTNKFYYKHSYNYGCLRTNFPRSLSHLAKDKYPLLALYIEYPCIKSPFALEALTKQSLTLPCSVYSTLT